MKKTQLLLISIATVGLLTAARYKKIPSPFLGNYEQFKPSKDNPDMFIYRAAGKKAADYDRVIFDPVLIFQSENSRLKKLESSDMVDIAQMLQSALNETFKDAVKIVDKPGAGVLRMRFAIRGLAQGVYYMDAKGDHRIKNDPERPAATFEAEGIDSLTGERIVALVNNLSAEQFKDMEKEEVVFKVDEVFAKWAESLKQVYLEEKSASMMK